MVELKGAIADAWERQDAVFCFFEQGMNLSLARFSPSPPTDESDCEADRGWFENYVVDDIGEGGFDSSSICSNEDDHVTNSSDQKQDNDSDKIEQPILQLDEDIQDIKENIRKIQEKKQMLERRIEIAENSFHALGKH